MTNDEAREVLQEQIDRYGQEYDAEGIEALEMAIRALSSWSIYSDELWKKAYARGYNDAKTLEQQQYKKVLIKDHDSEPITYRGILDTEEGIVYMKDEPLERLKHYGFTIEEEEE